MDYPTWLSALREWVEYQQSLQGGCIEMAARVAQYDVQVSPFTLRYHVNGRYHDVGLSLAHAVWKEIEKDSLR
jgi:hypothetical protein